MFSTCYVIFSCLTRRRLLVCLLLKSHRTPCQAPLFGAVRALSVAVFKVQGQATTSFDGGRQTCLFSLCGCLELSGDWIFLELSLSGAMFINFSPLITSSLLLHLKAHPLLTGRSHAGHDLLRFPQLCKSFNLSRLSSKHVPQPLITTAFNPSVVLNFIYLFFKKWRGEGVLLILNLDF